MWVDDLFVACMHTDGWVDRRMVRWTMFICCAGKALACKAGRRWMILLHSAWNVLHFLLLLMHSVLASTVWLSFPVAHLAFVAVGWVCPLLILMCWESQLHSAESPSYTVLRVPITHIAEPNGSTKDSSCCWIVSTCKNVDIPCWLMKQFLKLHSQIVKFNSTSEIIVLVHGV